MAQNQIFWARFSADPSGLNSRPLSEGPGGAPGLSNCRGYNAIGHQDCGENREKLTAAHFLFRLQLQEKRDQTSNEEVILSTVNSFPHLTDAPPTTRCADKVTIKLVGSDRRLPGWRKRSAATGVNLLQLSTNCC
jgi:hypothetical protein